MGINTTIRITFKWRVLAHPFFTNHGLVCGRVQGTRGAAALAGARGAGGRAGEARRSGRSAWVWARAGAGGRAGESRWSLGAGERRGRHERPRGAGGRGDADLRSEGRQRCSRKSRKSRKQLHSDLLSLHQTKTLDNAKAMTERSQQGNGPVCGRHILLRNVPARPLVDQKEQEFAWRIRRCTIARLFCALNGRPVEFPHVDTPLLGLIRSLRVA